MIDDRPSPIGRKAPERFLKPRGKEKEEEKEVSHVGNVSEEERKHFTPLVFSVTGMTG